LFNTGMLYKIVRWLLVSDTGTLYKIIKRWILSNTEMLYELMRRWIVSDRYAVQDNEKVDNVQHRDAV
jgi:hypothetical protein